MNATIPADCGKSIGLEIVGDQAAVTVTAVNKDGTITVTSEQEEPDNTEQPDSVPGSSNPALANLGPSQNMPAGMMAGGAGGS